MKNILALIINLKMSPSHLIAAFAAGLAFAGCAVSDQPKIANIGQLNGLKDYIAQKRAADTGNYDIIAERPRQTIIEYRTFNEPTNTADARDIMEVLDDAKEYCMAIGGNGIYGDQSIRALQDLPTAFSIDYVGYRNEMNRQGLGHYGGFYKCASIKDGFEIEYMKDNAELRQDHMIGGGYMRTYSRYYLLNHDKAQSFGFKTWMKSDKFVKYAARHKNPADYFGIDSAAQVSWKYERATGAQKFCTIHGGQLYIANALTKFGKMSIDDYLFTRLDQIKDKSTINIFMDKDYFWCENPSDKSQEFTLEHIGQNVYYKDGADFEYLKSKGVSLQTVAPEISPPRNLHVTNAGKSDVITKSEQKYEASVNLEKGLASYALYSKSDMFKSVGQNTYETSYNGMEPDGCEYASVAKRLLKGSDIHNFKQCKGGDVVYIGKTGVEELTDEAKDQLKTIGKRLEATCKLQNQATATLNGFTLKCIKNPSNNAIKTVMMKDGKMIAQMEKL